MTVAPDRAHDLKLGRSQPSPRPRIALRDFVDVEKAAALPAAQRQITMSWRVKQWPMFRNDQIGDCTCAGIAHSEQIAAVYALKAFTVTDQDVVRAYSAISGYDPQTGANDNGAMLTQAAGYARTTGLQGAPTVTAYAHVDPQDDEASEIAHWLFGGLLVGAAMPTSAQQQYQAGQQWDVTNNGTDAGTWGGHCMVRVNSILHRRATFVTWGGLQIATEAWQRTYIDEQLALVPADWQTHMPAYMAGAGLVDFDRLSQLVTQVTTTTTTTESGRRAMPDLNQVRGHLQQLRVTIDALEQSLDAPEPAQPAQPAAPEPAAAPSTPAPTEPPATSPTAEPGTTEPAAPDAAPPAPDAQP